MKVRLIAVNVTPVNEVGMLPSPTVVIKSPIQPDHVLFYPEHVEVFIKYPKWIRPLIRLFCFKHNFKTFYLPWDDRCVSGCIICGKVR